MKHLKLKKTIWPIVLVGIMASWASMYPFIKIIQGQIDPYLLAFFRFFYAAILLMPIIKITGQLKIPPKKDILAFILLSCITILPTVFIILGVSKSTAMSSAILVNSNPLIVALIAPFLIHEKQTVSRIIGMSLGFIGIIITVLNGHAISQVFASDYFLGSMLLLIAAFFLALFAMVSKKYVQKYGGLYVTYFTIAPGAILLLIFVLIQGSFFQVGKLSLFVHFIAFLIAFLATVLPFYVWNSSLRHMKTTVATSFKLLIPVFATIYAILFLQEPLTIWIIIGILLTSVGLFLVQKPIK